MTIESLAALAGKWREESESYGVGLKTARAIWRAACADELEAALPGLLAHLTEQAATVGRLREAANKLADAAPTKAQVESAASAMWDHYCHRTISWNNCPDGDKRIFRRMARAALEAK